MKKAVSGRVSNNDHGIRLEVFLKSRLRLTKNEISRAKFRENGICVNGERRKVNAPLKFGDLVEVLLETGNETSKGLKPSEKAISILYEDADVIVVNKPSGLSVHPAGSRDFDTLANRLAFYLRSKGEDSVIRIFGRLDKDTSGVVLAAKNRAAATRLERQRKTGQLSKSYLAIAEGTPVPAKGTVNVPLGANPKKRKQMCVTPEGKQALTHYETLETRNGLSLLSLRLETGRTHQIRVHMASVGCPLLGDPLYGNGEKTPEMKRTALHAQRVCFLQPFTGEALQVEAPIPKDMKFFMCPLFRQSTQRYLRCKDTTLSYHCRACHMF